MEPGFRPARARNKRPMAIIEDVRGEVGLTEHGIEPAGTVYSNPTVALLYTHALKRDEGRLAEGGPLVVDTGIHTGRSPNDKFVVREPGSEERIWWGKVNQEIGEHDFESLRDKITTFLGDQDLYVVDAFAGADPAHRLPLRVISYSPWHALFAKTLFIDPTPEELAELQPQALVLHAPEVEADPDEDGTRSGTFVVLHPSRMEVLIGGTFYAGEIKKSIFTLMNDRLPLEGVLPMHCSANVGDEGDVAIFFGLSGTGKTTLSADPERHLIGDDEHGWSEEGVFNFEGGCYAKVINLSAEGEPDIYQTTQMFGTVLENVVLDPNSKKVDFANGTLTENTRASYPLHYMRNYVPGGRGGHPKNIVFLTADAFGVLPPIAKLTPEQAMYYFLSGYTAKVAGTERGVTEPQATFSSGFGAVFLVWHPTKYAEMLGKLIDEHRSQVWLLNTGWTGGAYGVGKRMKLAFTRAMVHALLRGDLAKAECDVDPTFGLAIPCEIRDVPADVLRPRETWQDKGAYDAQAKKLATMFAENFKKF